MGYRFFCLTWLFISFIHAKDLPISFEKENNIFAIILKDDNTCSLDKQLENEAEKICRENCYNKYIILSSQPVEMLCGKNFWPSAFDFKRNIYQEEIIERNYNHLNLINRPVQTSPKMKAIKYLIKCFRKSL